LTFSLKRIKKIELWYSTIGETVFFIERKKDGFEEEGFKIKHLTKARLPDKKVMGLFCFGV